jgi:hypothetical protein
MKQIILAFAFSAASIFSTHAFAAPPTEADFKVAFNEHLAYVAAMVQVFLDSPETADVAKAAVLAQAEALLTNTSVTVTYESMVLNSKGAVCSSKVADSIPGKLQFGDATRASVMFKPGSVIFVNTAFFRDMCIMYKRSPERIADLYNQHMAQIKQTTGGKTYDQLKK